MAECRFGAAITHLGRGSFMSERELEVQKTACQGYVFGDFTLDLDRGCLWHAGQEVKLRHKSFEVLKYLVEHPGRLVSKAEMMQALWPDAFVTDDSLVQCLIDVRRALGDDEQRYVKTILRRGYLFDAQVSESAQPGSDALARSDAGEISSATIEEQERDEKKARPNSIVLPIVLMAVLLLGGLGALLIWRSSRTPSVKRVAEIGSIAVLPFKSIDAASADEYLGLGMADDLITRLSNLQRVIVRPTSAVLKYSGGEPDPVTTGQALGVESVLEGSIRRSGDRIRVTVQLVGVRDGSPIWAQKFDEKFTDILSVQDAVAEQISQALALQLTGDERKFLTRRYTNNVEAYQHYLKGRYFLSRRTEAGYQKCLEHFQQAIKLDRRYAPAYAGVADAYNIMGIYVYGLFRPHEVYPKAREAAGEALGIDGTLGEAHAALGYTKLNYDWDWPGAEREIERAIELRPDDGAAQHYFSHYWMAMGRVEESLTASLRAVELDSFDLSINAHLGWHYLYARQYDLATEQLLKTIELDPNFVNSYLYLGYVYEQKGMPEAAIEAFSKAIKLSGEGRRPVMEAALGHAYAVAAKKTEAQRVLAGLMESAQRRFISPYNIAVIYVGLGDREQAFLWLNRAYTERDNWLNYLKVEPRLDPLRSDPRFTDLLRRVGLAP